MTMKKKYKDCFARIEVRCGVLNETLCKNGECPFYKSKKEYEADKVKYPPMESTSHKKIKKEGASNG